MSREQGGKKVKFDYDTEEQLTAVINEKGETYQFERDTKGNIIKEIGFDEMERTYERSLAGLVQRIQRPGDRWTAYQHDGLGNVIRADYYDDTWETFSYDKNGSLIATENEHVTVKLERDPSGQVIKEWQNDHWIASTYDELGNRSQITSSLGAKIDVARNEMGIVSQITASRSEQEHWIAAMQYNELGQEIERILPGDVISKWQYDVAGRPTHHRINSQNRDTRRRAYNWDANHRLRSMVNELTGVKVTYGYDEFSNLVWSNQGDQFDFLHRSVDDVGNLYETKEKIDRVYGAGSRLLETKETTFSYDDEGNLVQKVEKNGDTWKFEYYGNGMMSKAILFSQGKPIKEVKFKYDSLSRRIEKACDGRATHFIWDRNTTLHEWVECDYTCETSVSNESTNTGFTNGIDRNLVTWIFNEDKFIPSAKITSRGNYSIISDYLGTPVEAYDLEGKKVWSSELDIYGRVKEFTGEKDFIPFKYQGQYEDYETGLYYNRFRYYSPREGIYTQVDSIGLVGGNPTLYGYVHNPLIEIDPFGLDSAKLDKALGGAIGDGMEAHHLIPEEIWGKHQAMFDHLGMGMDSKSNGIHMPSSNSRRNQMGAEVYHRGSHPQYSRYVDSRVNKIKSKWKPRINDDATIKRLQGLQTKLKGKIKAGDVPRGKVSCYKLG
ncbi:RHS repeat domain-containing protein [Lysinibacillus sp. NPDC059133]|uniref:RHS repeat domain-containing protein n=1 Tax=Lysinibacillus sp. NPDC059133 TaxID=3346737 RepID=UPI00369BF1B8